MSDAHACDRCEALERRVQALESWVVQHARLEAREHRWLFGLAAFVGTIVVGGALAWLIQLVV